MKKTIKKSFDILIKNSAIMQPLILYILVMLFFNVFMGTKIFPSLGIKIIFSLLMILLLSAFLSGWFETIKYAIDNYKEFNKSDEDYAMQIARYNIETGKRFFQGVGEYIMPVFAVIIVYLVFNTVVFIVGLKFLNISNTNLYSVLTDNKALTSYILAHPKESGLFLLFVGGVLQIFQFLIMFWLPTIYYKIKNPFSSLFSSIKFLFQNFLYSLGVYLFIICIVFVSNFISVITSRFYILSLLFVILGLFIATYIFVLIFDAYRFKNMQLEIEKINAQDRFIKSCDNKEADEKNQE